MDVRIVMNSKVVFVHSNLRIKTYALYTATEWTAQIKIELILPERNKGSRIIFESL